MSERPAVALQEDKPAPDQGVKGIEMEGDFEGEMEDIPPNDDSNSDEPEGEEDRERLQQEVGEVGDTGETVDERLWGEDDKPEEGQQGPEKKEKDSTVQVLPGSICLLVCCSCERVKQLLLCSSRSIRTGPTIIASACLLDPDVLSLESVFARQVLPKGSRQPMMRIK